MFNQVPAPLTLVPVCDARPTGAAVQPFSRCDVHSHGPACCCRVDGGSRNAAGKAFQMIPVRRGTPFLLAVSAIELELSSHLTLRSGTTS